MAGSAGEFYWGGAASTAFWIDPVEDLFAVFMTQLLPSVAYPFRAQLRGLVYQAIETEALSAVATADGTADLGPADLVTVRSRSRNRPRTVPPYRGSTNRREAFGAAGQVPT